MTNILFGVLLTSLLSSCFDAKGMHIICVCNYICVTLIPTVILESSSNQTCPGDTVTYTCVTDTGQLVWSENNKAQVLFTIDNHPPQQLDIFVVNLTSISGIVIVSTATINNVLLEHNGTVLLCSDNAIPQLADTINRTVIISGIILLL